MQSHSFRKLAKRVRPKGPIPFESNFNRKIRPAQANKSLDQNYSFKRREKRLYQSNKNNPRKTPDPQVLCLKSLVNFALNYFFDAITDVENTIETCDEPNALHYIARGGCYAWLSMFREAITDLSIAISLNNDLLDVRETMFHLILGLFEQREVRVFGRWHRRVCVYGLSKDYSD